MFGENHIDELTGKFKVRSLFRLFSVSALALVSAISAWASIYAYTDAQGRIRITDIPDREGHEIVLPRISPRTFERSAAPAQTPRTAYPAPSTRTSGRRSPEEFRGIVREAAKKYRLSESLIFAVMRAESGFNPNAVSPAGAQGLMQLIPSTARLVGCRNSFDPEQNINGGAKYLRQMMDRFGRVDLALAAYNAGPQAVERYGGIPPYNETRNYVPRVLKYYREFGGVGSLNLAAATSSTTRSTTRRSSTNRRSTPAAESTRSTTVAKANPIFYYRGPDGQIYISNIRN